MNLKNVLLSILMVLVVAFALPLQVQAVATSQPLLGAAWNHDPVTVYISLQRGVDASYSDEVKTAFNNWSAALKAAGGSTGFNFTFRSTAPPKKNPADITVTVRKNTGTILGVTSISSTGGVFNPLKITLSAYNALGLPLGREDFRSIARHEIGHALGLGHSNDNGNEPIDLMAATFDFVGVNYDIYPSSLNVSALRAIYGTDGFGLPNNPIPASYP